jgi:hypothetical protein
MEEAKAHHEQREAAKATPTYKFECHEYVTLEYHEEVVAKLKQEITKAYSQGKSDGGPEYSWRL